MTFLKTLHIDTIEHLYVVTDPTSEGGGVQDNKTRLYLYM